MHGICALESYSLYIHYLKEYGVKNDMIIASQIIMIFTILIAHPWYILESINLTLKFSVNYIAPNTKFTLTKILI